MKKKKKSKTKKRKKKNVNNEQKGKKEEIKNTTPAPGTTLDTMGAEFRALFNQGSDFVKEKSTKGKLCFALFYFHFF